MNSWSRKEKESLRKVRHQAQRQEYFVYQRMEKQEKGSTTGKCDTENTERNNTLQKQAKREDNEKK